MIKKLTRLLGNIVGRIKKMVTSIWIGIGTMMMPVGISLMTIQLVSDNAPTSLFYVGVVAGIIGFISLILATIRAFIDDAELRKDRKTQQELFRGLSKSINNINDEIRQDRNERNRKR